MNPGLSMETVLGVLEALTEARKQLGTDAQSHATALRVAAAEGKLRSELKNALPRLDLRPAA